jgi:hypothetical protein
MPVLDINGMIFLEKIASNTTQMEALQPRIGQLMRILSWLECISNNMICNLAVKSTLIIE